MPSLDPSFVTISNGTSITAPASTNYQPTALQSLFGRLDYIYNDRYILGATLRRDASSKFAPGQRVGYFPSVSLAWRITQEDFLKSVS